MVRKTVGRILYYISYLPIYTVILFNGILDIVFCCDCVNLEESLIRQWSYDIITYIVNRVDKIADESESMYPNIIGGFWYQ